MTKFRQKQTFGLRWSTRKCWACAAFFLVLALGGLTAVTIQIKSTNDIKAIEANIGVDAEDNLDEYNANGVIYTEDDDKVETYKPKSSSVRKRGGSSEQSNADNVLPEQYNTRDTISTVRVKNQKTEDLCWAYSSTTTLEYYLAKKYKYRSEFSPKYIDYHAVDGDEAYIEDGAQNLYYDRYSNYNGYSRSLGDGANYLLVMSLFSNPLAIEKESNFTNIIKQRDERLGSIERYEDIWDLENKDEILEQGNTAKGYYVKQAFDEINNSNNVEYIVTGVEKINYNKYESSSEIDDERNAVITDIKNAIVENGAVRFAVRWNFSNQKCLYRSWDGSAYSYTMISRSDVTECNDGHAMTLVGWDDNWEYYDGEELRRGAFIIQNSWGVDSRKWYLSYYSEFDILVFDQVEEYSAYDNYYSLADYKDQTETYAANEQVFEFQFEADSKERLNSLTFTDLYNSHNYDVSIKRSGESNFKKVGSFTSRVGITKYTFEDDYMVDGDFTVKLTSTNADIFTYERARNILNVMTDDVTTYNLSFDTSEGVANLIPQTCDIFGQMTSCAVTIPQATPTRTNYHFLGWADAASSTTANYQAGDTVTLTADQTIYAIWAPIYTLSFDNNISENEENLEVLTPLACHPNNTAEACSVRVYEARLEREGYKFFGYATNQDATVPEYAPGSEFAFELGSYEEVLYAVWADGSVELQDYTKWVGEDLVIRINYPMNSLNSVLVDGVALDDSKHKVESGSTIITLYADYLDTLEAGSHTLRAVYDGDIIAEVPFAIVEEEVPVPNTAGGTSADDSGSTAPNTGKNTNNEMGNKIATAIYVVPLVLLVAGYLTYKRHKGHRKFDR